MSRFSVSLEKLDYQTALGSTFLQGDSWLGLSSDCVL